MFRVLMGANSRNGRVLGNNKPMKRSVLLSVQRVDAVRIMSSLLAAAPHKNQIHMGITGTVPHRGMSSLGSIFSLDNVKAKIELAKLQNLMSQTSNPDDKQILDYIRVLGSQKPHEAIKFIENGWESNKIPVDEMYLREYFKAAAAIGKIDKLNISSLLSMLNKNTAASSNDRSSLFRASMSSGSSGFSAGTSVENPLYLARQMPSAKEMIMKLIGYVFMILFGYALIGVLISDEKGGPMGGAGRLSMGSVVKQAEQSDKSFDDVVGIDEAKRDLEEIVLYLKDPKRFTRLGGRLPKGVLLTGPPGTGKTLLARAIAGEAGVPFFHTSGSEFEEMYVGVGAKRVRELFEVANSKKPCIIFIDEIDAIGGTRQVKDQSAMKMTLNQLLVEMDGFRQNSGVIVIAATNFPDSLDAALIRPGRFDKHVDVTLPDIRGREEILNLYGKKIQLDSDVDMSQLARGTPGFSGAELSNLVNQAALKASIDGLKAVGMGALEYAKDKIMMGAERKSAVISPDTMKCTAYHEAGHALVALKTAGSDPIHKATIMPRGRSLGMVMQLPDGDQTSMSRKQMLARLDVCMGGRVAEELIFGEENVTSGASNDLMQATRLAKAMVTKYGFSDKVGVMYVDDKAKVGGGTTKDIDDEIRALVQASYARAYQVLDSHKKELELIANGLMEYESLSGGEIVDLSMGKKLDLVKRSQKPSRELQVLPFKRKTQVGSGSSSSSSNDGGGAAGKGTIAASRIVQDPSAHTGTPTSNSNQNYTTSAGTPAVSASVSGASAVGGAVAEDPSQICGNKEEGKGVISAGSTMGRGPPKA
jgi:ATP-dependent metalloprotease